MQRNVASTVARNAPRQRIGVGDAARTNLCRRGGVCLPSLGHTPASDGTVRAAGVGGPPRDDEDGIMSTKVVGRRRQAAREVCVPGVEISQRFETEMLLPCQYLDRIVAAPSLQPEKRLMLAVLESAVATYQKFALTASRRGRRLFGEAEAWVTDPQDVWVFSFENICSALELDAAYLRAGLHRWRERAMTSPARGPFLSPFRRVSGRRNKVSGRPPGVRGTGAQGRRRRLGALG